MKIFYGIDGTSNSDPSPNATTCDLPTAMALSPNRHVKRVMRFGFAKQQYVEGTFDEMAGQSSVTKIRNAVMWLQQAYQSAGTQVEPKIFLSGFSRGAAAILCVSHELNKLGIPVHGMYLFDAVDRAYVMPNSQTGQVPGNVKHAFHAMRDPLGGSRKTFGNCGLEGTNGNLLKKPFETTHGGVGGWPYGDTSMTAGGLRGMGNYPGALLVAGVTSLIDRGHAGHIHERGEPTPTNLTPQQETAGMKRAWDWMSGNISSTMR